MNWMEILGYVASVITAISLMMSSVVKLRWINLVGSTLFGVYGIFINAIPVAGLNFFIAAINIYYLWKMHSEKQHFQLFESSSEDKIIREFIQLNQADIRKYFPNFSLEGQKDIVWMIHRNFSLVGLFIGHKQNESTLVAELDFVLPPYRDLKPGSYLYNENKPLFLEKGFGRITGTSSHPEHIKYLNRVGFKEEEGAFVLALG